ncbi:MAG TPA: phosphatase PAP2 family protein [Bryobacteraceae bacterium]|nr:phosphatase PAP2 family protein [Bryobacteraceae bacterium]
MTHARQRRRFQLLAWLGSHELSVLMAIAALAAGAWLFSYIASEVTHGDTQAFDRALLLSMRNPDGSPIGSAGMREAARDITGFGGVATLSLVTVFTCVYLLLDGGRRMAVFVFGSVISGLILSTILKEVFQRPRPNLVPHGSYVDSPSFPSGHSMLSAVAYLTLGALLARAQSRKRLKAFFLLAAALLSFLVGVSRVYLGVHWPTDVLAGWTAGACWAIICWLTARWLQLHRAIEAEAS